MRKEFIVVGVLFLLGAGLAAVARQPSPQRPPESWVEENMLESVGDFTLRPKEFGSKISYKMDELSYETLRPIGIACQIFEDSAGRQIDVVVIAGDSSESFHDQRICFAAQGWEIVNLDEIVMRSERLKDIPATRMTIKKPGMLPKESLYIFRSPSGFVTYNRMKFDFLTSKVRNPLGYERGFSYRFIGLTDSITLDELKAFAIEYLEKLSENPDGLM